MLKIDIKIEYNGKKHRNTYVTEKNVSLKEFREIINIIKKEAEASLPFFLHHHGKPRKGDK